MRAGLLLICAALLAACGPDTAYLNRWDDPRVIQVHMPHWHTHCLVQQTRPSRAALSAIAAFERVDGPPACPWYDGVVRFERRTQGVQTLVGPREDGPLRSCLNIAHHRSVRGCPELTSAQSVAEAIRTLTPEGVAQQDICLAVSVDQSLAVSEVFALRNQFLDQGVTCLMVIQEWALTEEG